MADKKILIIEDEEKLARVLQLELEYENYTVVVKHNGKDGLESLLYDDIDLVLLDVMLPALSGLEVLRRARKSKKFLPIILLTARDQVPDKVSGFDLGANDYVTKPFEIEELLARIRAHLRTTHKEETEDEVLKVKDLSVHIQSREITRGDKSISLTKREFDLLLYLVKNINQVLTREQILRHVWGFDYVGETNVVDVYIRYLRQKIDKDFSQPLLHTVRGVGYSLKGK